MNSRNSPVIMKATCSAMSTAWSPIRSSCLERVGDHAVDIGEQAAFLATGEFREFTDASHDPRPLG